MLNSVKIGRRLVNIVNAPKEFDIFRLQENYNRQQ